MAETREVQIVTLDDAELDVAITATALLVGQRVHVDDGVRASARLSLLHKLTQAALARTERR